MTADQNDQGFAVAPRMDLTEPPPDIQSVARNIVNQLFDEAGVPVETRQAINDRCDSFVAALLVRLVDEQSHALRRGLDP